MDGKATETHNPIIHLMSAAQRSSPDDWEKIMHRTLSADIGFLHRFAESFISTGYEHSCTRETADRFRARNQ